MQNGLRISAGRFSLRHSRFHRLRYNGRDQEWQTSRSTSHQSLLTQLQVTWLLLLKWWTPSALVTISKPLKEI
jgi:hypothetical protein